MVCQCGAEVLEGETRCRPCHARYMRQWRKIRRELLERRAYLKGAEDTRVLAIRTFEEIGPAQLNGNAAAEIIKRLCST